jgi:hypothetical protein
MQSRNYFDETVAKTYDHDHRGTESELVGSTVEVLHEMAGTGPILEFAIGTGRIALPLAARGCTVKGIELSEAMVTEMRKKETGSQLEVTIGDMTSVCIDEAFSLVFLVFNTIDNLVTQESQLDCFRNAAAHLETDGRFVVETLVPPLQRLPFGESKLAFACSPEKLGIDDFDVVTQNYTSNHVWIENGQQKRLTIPFRYAWPSELDLMAQFCGFELEHRWENWKKAPFTKLSRQHISVWKKTSRSNNVL